MEGCQKRGKVYQLGLSGSLVKFFDSDFINSANDYLSTPNEEKKDSYPPTEENTPLVEKNTANLASIVASARPPPKTMKPRARPRAKSKPKVSKKTGNVD